MATPIAGDVVHFFGNDLTTPVPALITAVYKDGVTLYPFSPPLVQYTHFADEHVPHSTQPASRHWTERPTS